MAPPGYDKPLTGTMSLSLRAGAEWGTCTPPTVDNYSVFIEKTRFPYENGPDSSWETIIQHEKVIAFFLVNRSIQPGCGECYSSLPVTMIAAVLDGTPQRRIEVKKFKKNSPPAVPRRGPEAGVLRTKYDFS